MIPAKTGTLGLAGPLSAVDLARIKAALGGRGGHLGGALKAGTSFGSLLRDTPASGEAAPAPGGHHKHGFDESAPNKHRHPGDATLDSVARHAAQLAPPMAHGQAHAPVPLELTAAPSPAVAEARARGSLEDLLPALVRKVAWSGDGRRGAVRLELGAGALQGATLLVQSEDGRVRVHLSAPPGSNLQEWRARIAQRLAARGLAVDSVDVE
jgi:hypothetical protein